MEVRHKQHSWLGLLLEYVSIGDMRGRPSQLQRVCVGQSSLQQIQDQINISWDPLPCHLQNGANISRYIIQDTHLASGTSRNISSHSDSRLECHQVPGGPYSCEADASLFITRPGETYRFQVAAQNVHGIGPFSIPIIFMFQNGPQGKHIIIVNY